MINRNRSTERAERVISHKRELASAMIVKMLTSIFELWGHDGTPKRLTTLHCLRR
jgi:hypothetical protein